jgi:hypothetical protein
MIKFFASAAPAAAASRALTLSLALIWAACGQQPSFEEEKNQTESSRNSGVVPGEAGSDDQAAADAGSAEDGTSADAEANRGGEGSPDIQDDAGADSGTDGGVDGAGDGSDSGDDAVVGDDSDGDDGEGVDGTPAVDPSTVLDDDGGTLVIPGVKVQKVGVNFEDLNDFDFNDAVLCFQGNFKIDGTTVTSYQRQTVSARTYSASACKHRIDVVIVHPDGTRQAFNYRSDSGVVLQLPFLIKSRLEVTMTTIEGSCSRTPVSMHNTRYALVKPNVCNTTGN